MPETAAPTGLVVRVAGVRWYIPAPRVVEVVRGAAVARIPMADPAVLGLMNHRGRILTVVDPVRALALPGASGGGRDLVVVEGGGHRFVVATDAVIELVPEARTGLAVLDVDRIAAAIFP
jgi:purine-binding chemotaxis protein CheW